MRALRRNDAGISLDRACAEPAIAPGWAILRPTRVGVGIADLAAARADSPFRGVLGQEFVAIVERAEPGEGLTTEQARVWKGKRVVGSPHVPCGVCELCTRGLSAHCRDARVMGEKNLDGCFADAFTLPVANLVEVPRNIDDDAAVLANALADALHTAAQLRIEGKPYITVLGDGRVGLLCAQVMAKLNASVRVVGLHEHKLALCEKWGVKHRLLRDVGRRADQDIVVECTGSREGLSDALRMVRPRGKVLLKSRWNTPRDACDPIDLSGIVEGEIEVIGSKGGSIAEAVQRLAQGDIDAASLITRRMKLDDGIDALRAAASPEQIKVVMDV